MARVKNPRTMRLIRHKRLRQKVQGTSFRPRLAVFRSLNNIYAQVIDDTAGHTLVAASSLESRHVRESNGVTKTQSAQEVGTEIAQRAKAAGVVRVVFDRGGYKYHGRVKALAEAARAGGLDF